MLSKSGRSGEQYPFLYNWLVETSEIKFQYFLIFVHYVLGLRDLKQSFQFVLQFVIISSYCLNETALSRPMIWICNSAKCFLSSLPSLRAKKSGKKTLNKLKNLKTILK